MYGTELGNRNAIKKWTGKIKMNIGQCLSSSGFHINNGIGGYNQGKARW